MSHIILSDVGGVTVIDFLYDIMWKNVNFWRYISIVSLFLIVFYKKKIRHYEEQRMHVEDDKNLIRKVFHIFSELKLKHLMNDLIKVNTYSEIQVDRIKDFENYLNEIDEKFQKSH